MTREDLRRICGDTLPARDADCLPPRRPARLVSGWWILPGVVASLALVGSCAFGDTLPWLAPDGSTRQWEGHALIVCAPAADGWAPVCQDWTMDGLRRDKGGDALTAPAGASILAWREHLAPPAYAAPSGPRLACGPYSPELVVDRHCRPVARLTPPVDGEAVIPAPGALTLLLLGLAGLMMFRRAA